MENKLIITLLETVVTETEGMTGNKKLDNDGQVIVLFRVKKVLQEILEYVQKLNLTTDEKNRDMIEGLVNCAENLKAKYLAKSAIYILLNLTYFLLVQNIPEASENEALPKRIEALTEYLTN